uniref:Cleavage and polyadenylation specificity factor subunit 6 n=1 Tax=Neogobius melanostomus TaxID=47308 RepID=A0A8C6UM29_9GOBI
MADGVDHIDIYADVEEEFNQEAEYPVHEQIDLYDDVISPSANNGDAPEDRDYLDSAPGATEGGKSAPANVVYTYSGKRIALYIGNLTWWTTDEDLTEAIRSIGITDVLEIKFFENRANGQSKGPRPLSWSPWSWRASTTFSWYILQQRSRIKFHQGPN